jgi:hypothetical protein
MAEKKRLWDDRPIQYTEDRFVPPPATAPPRGRTEPEAKDRSDVDELFRRPERRGDDRTYQCNDTSPLNYTRGPHDDEFGVDERDGSPPDADAVPYERGPDSEEEFGVDDDLEDLDDEPEFPEV